MGEVHATELTLGDAGPDASVLTDDSTDHRDSLTRG
jgi:hypothetical protein